jgi:hypothetical protein
VLGAEDLNDRTTLADVLGSLAQRNNVLPEEEARLKVLLTN